MLKKHTTNLRNKIKPKIQIHKNNRRVEELFKNNVLKNQISFILNFKSIWITVGKILILQKQMVFRPIKMIFLLDQGDTILQIYGFHSRT